MAETTWPDGSPRAVSDIEYELLGQCFAPDGVYGVPSDPTTVFADSTGRQVKVRAGKSGVIHGQGWASGSTDTVKLIGANTTGFSRYDLVVLGLDRATWLATTYIKQGTPASTPLVPALERVAAGTGTGKWEIPLARVTVAAGTSSINSGDVVNYAQYLGPPPMLYVATRAALAFVPSPVLHQLVYVTALQTVFRWTGTLWVHHEPGSIVGGQEYQGSGVLGTGPTSSHDYLGMSTGTVELAASSRYLIEAQPALAVSSASDMRCWMIIGKGATLNTVGEMIPLVSTAYTSQPQYISAPYTTSVEETVEFRLWGRASQVNWFQTHRRTTAQGAVPYMHVRYLGPAAGVLAG